jgi:hypothetical protein
VKSFNEREDIFRLAISHYEDLEALHREYRPYHDLWNYVSDFDLQKNTWMNGPFQKLSFSNIEKKIQWFL